MRLLVEEGFIPLDYTISTRYRSCMEMHRPSRLAGAAASWR